MALTVTGFDERWLLAVRQFNKRQFYECHETLEMLWLKTAKQCDKNFYQGVLMIAVGCYHWLEKQNHHGAVRKLSQGLNKLATVNADQCPQAIHLMPFIEASQTLLDTLMPLSDETIKAVSTSLLPVIEKAP